MNRNYRLLDEIVQIIEAEPEMWNQGYWGLAPISGERGEVMPACKTAKCVAGWAVSLRDYDLVYDQSWRNAASTETCKHIVTGESKRIDAAARDLLGLSFADSDRLFNGDNDLDAIKSIIRKWKVEDGIIKLTCDTCGQELSSPADSVA
jgi:hypothetical protein